MFLPGKGWKACGRELIDDEVSGETVCYSLYSNKSRYLSAHEYYVDLGHGSAGEPFFHRLLVFPIITTSNAVIAFKSVDDDGFCPDLMGLGRVPALSFLPFYLGNLPSSIIVQSAQGSALHSQEESRTII